MKLTGRIFMPFAGKQGKGNTKFGKENQDGPRPGRKVGSTTAAGKLKQLHAHSPIV